MFFFGALLLLDQAVDVLLERLERGQEGCIALILNDAAADAVGSSGRMVDVARVARAVADWALTR